MSAPSLITIPGLTLAAWTAAKVVVVVETDSSLIATAAASAGTHDGVSVSENDRVLVITPSPYKHSGIYAAGQVTGSRATDADASGEFTRFKTVAITHGTANAGRVFRYIGKDSPTIGSDGLQFAAGPVAIALPT